MQMEDYSMHLNNKISRHEGGCLNKWDPSIFCFIQAMDIDAIYIKTSNIHYTMYQFWNTKAQNHCWQPWSKDFQESNIWYPHKNADGVHNQKRKRIGIQEIWFIQF